MSTITEQDRLEWAQNPVTKELLNALQSSLQETKDSWAMECFVGESAEQGALQNATALGGVRVLVDLITKIESCDRSQEEVTE